VRDQARSLEAEGGRIRYLTSQLRRKLKKPLGILICGSSDQILGLVRDYVDKEKPPKVVTVGDQVSKNLSSSDLRPDILIVDNKTMRKKIKPISASADKVVAVRNPPGTITCEAWAALDQAVQDSETTKIVVEGEEDLLALVAIIVAPENSVVIYGQPRRGIVLVRTTSEMKRLADEIVASMEERQSDETYLKSRKKG
jgi:uncharacterized protein (UPF0218 family)